MVDTVVGTGTSGRLIIRDNGLLVQAIISCSNGSTFVSGASWSVTLGGGSASGAFSISGAQDIVVWSGNVTTTAAMTFSIGSTGTGGLGGPASVSTTINRTPASTVPVAPTIKPITNILPTSFQINFEGNGAGGATIDYFLVRYGTSNPPENGTYVEFRTTIGANPRSGLLPDTTYYARVYAHNINGYSSPSGTTSALTTPAAHVRVGGVWKYAIPWVRVSGVWKKARPYIKVGTGGLNTSGVWKKVK